jgi:hypothetical protein
MKMGTLKQISMVLSLGVCLALAVGQNASAVNTVSVASRNATAGQTDFAVPIFLVNDVDLRAITMPLMIRKLGPAYMNSVKLDDRGRLDGFLEQISFNSHLTQGQTDTAGCKRYGPSFLNPKSPGGFFSLFSDNDSLKHIATAVPYGILFARNRIIAPAFAAGSDLTGSFVITMDLRDEVGCFEIDTTCTDPYIHLLFGRDTTLPGSPRYPQFLPGVIHVGECQGTALASPDPASMSPTRGLKAATLTWDPVTEAAGYEVQIDTVDGTFANIWAQVTVQGTAMEVTLPGDPEVAADFFWRVRSVPVDCGFCIGPWTEPAKYTDVQTIASGGIPDSYILNQNYPNPFNASTVIQFTNKHDGNVTLEIFNILGQNVATLMEGFKPLGVYAVTWDGTDSRGNTVPSGMYFYRVSTDDFISVKKMTLLK